MQSLSFGTLFHLACLLVLAFHFLALVVVPALLEHQVVEHFLNVGENLIGVDRFLLHVICVEQ